MTIQGGSIQGGSLTEPFVTTSHKGAFAMLPAVTSPKLPTGMECSRTLFEPEDGSRTKTVALALTLALTSKTAGLGLDVLASTPVTHL